MTCASGWVFAHHSAQLAIVLCSDSMFLLHGIPKHCLNIVFSKHLPARSHAVATHLLSVVGQTLVSSSARICLHQSIPNRLPRPRLLPRSRHQGLFFGTCPPACPCIHRPNGVPCAFPGACSGQLRLRTPQDPLQPRLWHLARVRTGLGTSAAFRSPRGPRVRQGVSDTPIGPAPLQHRALRERRACPACPACPACREHRARRARRARDGRCPHWTTGTSKSPWRSGASAASRARASSRAGVSSRARASSRAKSFRRPRHPSCHFAWELERQDRLPEEEGAEVQARGLHLRRPLFGPSLWMTSACLDEAWAVFRRLARRWVRGHRTVDKVIDKVVRFGLRSVREREVLPRSLRRDMTAHLAHRPNSAPAQIALVTLKAHAPCTILGALVSS